MKTRIEQPRVLLVEDDTDARAMYGEYLRSSGFAVVEAANGLEALQRARRAAPDVIVMDLLLPVMDGWEATRHLKADSRTAGIPVVALSGLAPETTGQQARSAGCDAFLTKPCLMADFVGEIRRALEGARRQPPAGPS